MESSRVDGPVRRRVFLAGGTGHLGSRLIPRLLARGHSVSAPARKGSEVRLPAGCWAVTGDALDDATFRDRVAPADSFVQLVGVAHPSPAKAAQFRSIDLVSARAIAALGLSATVLRPWYVLGPGHRWPYALIPVYWLCERLPATREGARRLGLVTLRQMVDALVRAVEDP